VLPALVGLVRLRGLDSGFRILVALFSVDVINIGLQILLAFRGINNLWLSHFYGLIEFVLIASVLSSWSGLKWRSNLRLIIVLFVVFWIFAQFFLEPMNESAYFTSLVSKVLYTGFSIILLHKMSGDASISILRDPRFWFLSGLLVFATGGIMFSALRGVIDKLPLEGLLMAYSIHWGISILTSLIFTIGFLCKPQVQNSGGQLELAR